MEPRKFVCPKCGCTHYEVDEFRATGSKLAKFFDIQNKKFITISCQDCGYTEIYKRTTSNGENVLDFFIGS